MDKLKVYNLIDSLLGLFNGSVDGVGEKIIEGINGFLGPVSSYFYLNNPQMGIEEKYAGDLAHKNIFLKYRDQLQNMDVDSAEFALSSGDREVISCAALRQPRGSFGVLMVMTTRDHPMRHIIRQVLELYRNPVSS